MRWVKTRAAVAQDRTPLSIFSTAASDTATTESHSSRKQRQQLSDNYPTPGLALEATRTVELNHVADQDM